jgi:uncharacterized protein (TIGR03435 family)
VDKFDFELRFQPEEFQLGQTARSQEPAGSDAPPSRLAALQQQFEFKPLPVRSSTDATAVDRTEKPTEN